VRVERVALEHHRHAAVGGRHVVDALAADVDVTGADVFQARDHAQQGRLAAARRPDEDGELAVGDVEVDTADHFDVVVVALAHLAQGEVGHGGWSSFIGSSR
jgi:hypothetical protein